MREERQKKKGKERGDGGEDMGEKKVGKEKESQEIVIESF